MALFEPLITVPCSELHTLNGHEKLKQFQRPYCVEAKPHELKDLGIERTYKKWH